MFKILYLTFHFDPELGPAATRNTSIVKSLEKRATVSRIDVFTSTPTRWGARKVPFDEPEFTSKTNIYRYKPSFLMNHTVGQLFEFLRFQYFVLKKVKKQNYNLVFASSSKLGTATLGAIISRNKKIKYYLDIRDLFILTIDEYFKSPLFKPLKSFIKVLNAYTISNANRINCLSPGFIETVARDNPNVHISNFHHGIRKLNQNYTSKSSEVSQKYALYAGNIGFGQGIENIISKLGEALPGDMEFLIYGDGSEGAKIKEKIKSHKNIHLYSPISTYELSIKYGEAEILILCLNSSSAFKSSIPSKLFEYLGTEKPILAFCGGTTKNFVEQHKIPGVFFVDDLDTDELSFVIKTCVGNKYDRQIFTEIWSKDHQISKITDDILAILD